MLAIFVLSLKWNEFKKKNLTKYPENLLERLWPLTEELVGELVDGEIITDWSVVAVGKELFVNRGNYLWYMIRPATKTIWTASKPDKRYLGKMVKPPLWEVDELIYVCTDLLKNHVRNK